MSRVKIICRTKVLHKEDDEEEEIKLEGEGCCRKKINNFLTKMFWEYQYGNYIDIIDRAYYVVILPPEFYVEIPGYIWS
jgi:hypothetical protein